VIEVKIYRPARTAMQSGRAKTHDWLMEFVSGEPKRIDGLMGWSGSADTRSQVQMRFATLEEAIAHARRQGYAYTVDEPQERAVRPKSYAENFIRKT
jgi:hypothetical protein